jgi:HD-GYP domain-containing protein (c-di-GMP phosphodiesterase class II)
MNESNKKEKKEFLSKFGASASFMSLKETFNGIIDAETKAFFFGPDGSPVNEIKKDIDRCIINFLRNIRAKSGETIQGFKCVNEEKALFVPIIQGDNIYGYIILMPLKRWPDEKEFVYIRFFMDIVLKDFQKEQELGRLYDTIRPRAIALSTIHTIHRLLSSTLDMDELIERIARLTSQVMRARYCSIMLLDDSRNYLVPKAVIDLNNANRSKTQKKYKKIKVGRGPEGKVAQTGKVILTRDFLSVPLVEEDIIGVISSKDKTSNVPFSKFDLEILVTLAEQAVIAIKNAQLYEDQKKMSYGSIKSLGALLDIKSPHVYTHSEQFVKIVLAIAKEMRLSREETKNLRYAALLPDTGRFTIPDEILKKRGNLSKKEFEIIKKQHLESVKVLEPLEFLKSALPIITYHHERYNGTGYPEGLKGKQIPIGARIMAVVDAFEAMVSARPYKDYKRTVAEALKEIQNHKNSQFDPVVVDTFVLILQKPEFKKVF